MNPPLPTGWRRGHIPRPRNAVSAVDDGAGAFFRAIGSAAGLNVTGADALALPTLFRCVQHLADTIGTLPLKVMKGTAKGNVPADNHDVARLLRRPNPYMTGVDVRRTLAANQALYGEAFAQIIRDRAGRASRLVPIPTSRVTVKITDGVPEFQVFDALKARREVVDWNGMLHLRGSVSFNGISVLSPESVLRNTVALARAIDAHQTLFHENGGEPTIVLEQAVQAGMGAKLTDAQAAALRMQLEHRTRGGNTPVLLPPTVQLKTLDLNARDAMTAEMRRAQDEAICRAFGVPPYEVGIGDAKFSNAEQQGLNFVRSTVTPWCICWEAALAGALLSEADQATHVLKHNLAGLVRGDLAARSAAYAVGKQNGWLSTNDIRRLEDMPDIDGGDTYLEPLNMRQAGDGATGNPGTQTTRQSRIPSLLNVILP